MFHMKFMIVFKTIKDEKCFSRSRRLTKFLSFFIFMEFLKFGIKNASLATRACLRGDKCLSLEIIVGVIKWCRDGKLVHLAQKKQSWRYAWVSKCDVSFRELNHILLPAFLCSINYNSRAFDLLWQLTSSVICLKAICLPITQSRLELTFCEQKKIANSTKNPGFCATIFCCFFLPLTVSDYLKGSRSADTTSWYLNWFLQIALTWHTHTRIAVVAPAHHVSVIKTLSNTMS